MGTVLTRREQVVAVAGDRDRPGMQQVDMDRPLGERRERQYTAGDDEIAPVPRPQRDPQDDRAR